MYGCMRVRSHATHGQAWCKRCKMCITTRIFKMNILCSCYWGAAIQECSQNIFVLRSSHWDVFISKAVLNLWSISFKNTCDGVQLDHWCRRAIFHHIILLNNCFCEKLLRNCIYVLCWNLVLNPGFDLSFWGAVIKICPFLTLCWVNKDDNI